MIRTLLCLGFALTGLTANAEDTPKPSIPLEKIQAFADAFEQIRSSYVNEVSDEDLLNSAIRGMLSELDPHSAYLPPADFDDIREDTRGEFGGLGIEVARDNGLLRIVTPLDGTPADEAGLRPGDLITQIDDTPVMGMDLGNAIEMLRGPVDTEVVLQIQRGAEELDIAITRALIQITSVRSQFIEDRYVWLRISQFQDNTGPEALDKLNKLNDEQPIEGVILDLRNNPGGVLNAAVDVVNLFVDEGVVVSTTPRDPEQTIELRAQPSDFNFDEVPLVVLINEGSASASEIVAGAVQDMRRGVVMGTTSFGKGSVQTILPMIDQGALKLTTALYFTPDGRSIQNNGIVPDIRVQQGTLNVDESRLAFRERDLTNRLDNPNEPLDESEEGTNALTENDFQLAEALNMLKGISLVK